MGNPSCSAHAVSCYDDARIFVGIQFYRIFDAFHAFQLRKIERMRIFFRSFLVENFRMLFEYLRSFDR